VIAARQETVLHTVSQPIDFALRSGLLALR